MKTKKETSVHLTIYFKGQLTEDEVYKRLDDTYKDDDFQVYEIKEVED